MVLLRLALLDSPGKAHQELKQAIHGDATTVTAVAYRWGFSSSSRFAFHYQRPYGVLPSHTLHHD